MSCQSQSRTWGGGHRGGCWEKNWLVCWAALQRDLPAPSMIHSTNSNTQRTGSKKCSHTGNLGALHTLGLIQCVNAKKHHIHKTLIAHQEKRELMLLVTYIVVQLVYSIVTHGEGRDTHALILTQGFVSMVIDSSANFSHIHTHTHS